LVFDSLKARMLSGAGRGRLEVAMDVGGSWMKRRSFSWAAHGVVNTVSVPRSPARRWRELVTNFHDAHGRALDTTSAKLCIRVCSGPGFGEITNHFQCAVWKSSTFGTTGDK
jgi:hypothetical protein